MDLESLCAGAKRRYKRRQAERSQNESSLESKQVAKANAPTRLSKRLERFGAVESYAESVARSGEVDLRPPGDSRRAQIQDFVERVLGTNDLLGIDFVKDALFASRSVGRIVVQDPRAGGTSYGTGFTVSPNLLLTNHHVLRDEKAAAKARVEFNYEVDRNREALAEVPFQLDPDKFFVTSPVDELDYTLVAVTQNSRRDGAALSRFGWITLCLEEIDETVSIGELVNIIQHPDGRRKQLALRENEVVDAFEDFVHYKTDTAPGSSGSPVFNEQWEVVALHHSGVPMTDRQGRPLAKDGSVWRKSMGLSQVKWKANEGIQIAKVIKDARRRVRGSGQIDLVDEMLALRTAPERTDDSSIDSIPRAKETNGPTPGQIRIPLEISVSVRGGDVLRVDDARVRQPQDTVDDDRGDVPLIRYGRPIDDG